MFRYTIRALLWLTVAVALAVGYWNERRVPLLACPAVFRGTRHVASHSLTRAIAIQPGQRQ